MDLDGISQIEKPTKASIAQSPSNNKSRSIPIIIGMIILLIGVACYAYYLGTQSSLSNSLNTQLITPNPTSSQENIPTTPTSTPTTNSQVINTPSSAQVLNGANLNTIKYTLPPGWNAEIRVDGHNEEGLSINPDNGGGYLWIRVYDYPGTSGRRAYYCQLRTVCVDGTSYFNEIKLGNISGYSAHALDNSGGGTEYFGMKGNKFYIISSFDPPSPNEFEKNYKNVLNSLIF